MASYTQITDKNALSRRLISIITVWTNNKLKQRKQIGSLRTHMAEDHILPEANQILKLTADGLQ